MHPKPFLAGSALLCLAVAVPLQHEPQKRDAVWTTTIVDDIVTVAVTTTIWVTPGQTAGGQMPYGHGHNHGHASPANPTPTTPPIMPTAPAQPSAPAPAAPDTPQESSPASSPTSAAAPPPPPPPSTNSPAPAAPNTGGSGGGRKKQGGGGSGSGGGSTSGTTAHGRVHTGDITYYTPGLGSCGKTNGPNDMIVALAEDLMLPKDGSNPNNNPLCGRSITISHGGRTAMARIEDTCPGCAGASLDLTPRLFEMFAPLATGRVGGVEWWYN